MSNKRSIREEQRRANLLKRKRRRRKRIGVLCAEILILALLCMVGYVMSKYDRFQTVVFGENDIQTNEGTEKKGYMTVALFGGDSRTGALEKGAQSDTIVIASINHETKEVRLASVYRDTLTEQMNTKVRKANYAYFTGGPKDAINMLNKNFDLHIENYVTVDFKALADVVDLLGGIEVEVTDAEAKEMNKHMKETGKVANKKVNKLPSGGTYNLDGVQAVTYARIRKNVGGDYQRTERQRAVITKVTEKARKMNLSTVNKIINKVFPQISTSFTMNDMISLASGAFEYKISATSGFPMEAMNGRVSGVGSVIVPVGLVENVEELHNFLYPQEAKHTPSDTVRNIASKIEELTGITREKLNDPQADIEKSKYGVVSTEEQTENPDK